MKENLTEVLLDIARSGAPKVQKGLEPEEIAICDHCGEAFDYQHSDHGSDCLCKDCGEEQRKEERRAAREWREYEETVTYWYNNR